MHVEDKNTIHCIDIVWIITCLHQVLVRTSQLCIMYSVPRTLSTTTNKLCILHSPSWWGYYGPLLSGLGVEYWSGKHVTNRCNRLCWMLDWNTINSSTFQISDKSLKVDLYIFQLFNKKMKTKFCQKIFDFKPEVWRIVEWRTMCGLYRLTDISIYKV